LGEGLFYEVMNMAQLWSLPVIYVCENNLYNEYTHHSETTAGTILGRPRAFGIHAVEVDGQDVQAVNNMAAELVQRARTGKGPSFMLCNTYRYSGHHVGDIDRSYYRSKEEETLWTTERDPLKNLAQMMMDMKMVDAPIFEQIEKEIQKEVDAAVQFAINAPFPDVSEVDQDVYA